MLFDKSILDEIGIIDVVKITLKGKAIIITPADQTRKRTWSDFKKVKRESVKYFANTFVSKEWLCKNVPRFFGQSCKNDLEISKALSSYSAVLF